MAANKKAMISWLTLTLVTLVALVASTQLVYVEAARVPSVLLNSTSAALDADIVPEWYEDCVLHWTYHTGFHYEDVLVDRQPFTDRRTPDCDERVERCHGEEMARLSYPETDEPFHGSPLFLRALKNLVGKGHVKPFSYFEVNSRIQGVFAMGLPPDYHWKTPKPYEPFYEFRTSERGNCTDELVNKCRDYTCDQHSLEYWCHFFSIQKNYHM